jgi:hypothetical protein
MPTPAAGEQDFPLCGYEQHWSLKGIKEHLEYIAMDIYIYTSVNPRISILVSDDTESRQAELSGAGTVFSNSFFE